MIYSIVIVRLHIIPFYKGYCRHDIYWILVAFMIAASVLIKVSRLYGVYQHLYTKLRFCHRVLLYCVPMWIYWINVSVLQWDHNGCDGVSNHQSHHCLLNRLFRRRSKKTSQLRVTDLCAGNSTVTGELPAQMANNAESISIWWHHHGIWIWQPSLFSEIPKVMA